MGEMVPGTATVVSYQDTPFNNEFDMTIQAQMVVEGEGVPATSIELKVSIPKTQLPLEPNTAFQVHIDKDNPKHITFDQEDEQQSAEAGRAAAAQLAAQMRAGAAGAGGAAAGATNVAPGVQIVGAAGPEQAAAAMAKAEQALGMDLDGDGKIGGAGAPPPTGTAPPPAGGDEVDKLARLAKLKDDGALTSAEFEAEKKKLLGESLDP